MPPSNLPREVRKILTSTDQPEANELKNLLSAPHLKSLLSVHDIVSQDWKAIQATAARAESLTQHSNTFPQLNEPNIQKSNSDNQHYTSKDSGFNDKSEEVTAPTHVRMVQFNKQNDEPLGITLKMTNQGNCVIARVFHGGLIHRQGTLQAGDQIKEINGISVSNKTIEQLQAILKELRGAISFKIVPCITDNKATAMPEPNQNTVVTYIKTLFDYDPLVDDLIPCKEAGMVTVQEVIFSI